MKVNNNTEIKVIKSGKFFHKSVGIGRPINFQDRVDMAKYLMTIFSSKFYNNIFVVENCSTPHLRQSLKISEKPTLQK